MILIVVLALAARLYQVGWGLPYVYEEATPLKKAWEMWHWGSPRGVDPNPHFFHYPSLTIYLQFVSQGVVYLLMKITGAVTGGADYHARYIVDPTPVYHAGRLISVLFGTATVWLSFAVGRRLAPQSAVTVGISAAALLAVNTFVISRSHMVEVDVPLTFFVMLVFWLLLRLRGDPSLRRFLVAGAAIGLAASTKYTGALLVLPLVVLFLFQRFGAKPDGPRPLWWYPVASVAAAAAAFLLTSPYVLLDAGTFARHFGFERQHMQVGHFGVAGSSTIGYYVRVLTDRLIGWPAALFAVAGLAYAGASRKRMETAVLASFVVPYLVAIFTWSMRAERYVLPALPALLLFAAVAIAWLSKRVFFVNTRSWARNVFVTVAVALTAVPVVAAYPAYLKTVRTDSRTTAARWIETRVPSGSYLAVESYGPELFGPLEVSQVVPSVRNLVMERKKSDSNFAVLWIPMFQVFPENSGVFYDFSLYANADFFVITDAVKQRYLADRTRFARQVAFYDSLETVCRKVAEINPGGGGGSVITIYHNPRNTSPFAARRRVAPPALPRTGGGAGTGSEATFYYNMGLNYEVFSFLTEAIASYEIAVRYAGGQPTAYKNSVLRKTQCLITMGDTAGALKYLDATIPRAPDPAVREQLERLRARIVQRRGAGVN
jgi:4-amino-4-deoxy-L-arabinose transferase-like glycosyltransferase